MNAVRSLSGSDPDLNRPSVSEAPKPAPDAVAGTVWLLDPSRIGHLPACLRALGVSVVHERRED
jgi:hypothetical protein